MAESANIYLIIRQDTISGCLFGYLALLWVAKADNLMAMTLPNTEMEEEITYKKNLGVLDDLAEIKSWNWTKETFVKYVALTLLVVFNRLLRFFYVTVYFYFLPFLAIVAADIANRDKVKIEGDFVVPS